MGWEICWAIKIGFKKFFNIKCIHNIIKYTSYVVPMYSIKIIYTSTYGLTVGDSQVPTNKFQHTTTFTEVKTIQNLFFIHLYCILWSNN